MPSYFKARWCAAAESIEWEKTLQSLQDLIDAWVSCQSTWMYLEPIFTSADILKQVGICLLVSLGEAYELACMYVQRLLSATLTSSCKQQSKNSQMDADV